MQLPWNKELVENLFAGTGEVARALRSFDWSKSPLGDPSEWPTSLRVLVRQILDARFPMWVAWGPSLSLLYNDSCIPIMGEKHPGLLGCPLPEVWAEVWSEVEPLAQKALSGTSIYLEDEPYCIKRRGQMERAWFTYSWTPARNDTGAVQGIMGVMTETTARAKAEEALRKLNETLADEVATKTFERDQTWLNSQDLLLVADYEGVYRDVNPAWTEVLGFKRSELVGKHFLEFVHPEDKDCLLQAHLQAMERPLRTAEARFRHKDGSYRWLSWKAAPSKGAIYAVARDITADKEQAEALARSQAALRQAQKMEAVGQLTGGIAHDFNNLLATLVGNLELMRVRLKQGRVADLDNHISGALAASEKAASLTHRLLAFSRRDALNPKLVNVNDLLTATAELARRTVGPSISVQTDLDPGAWRTQCDPNQLENAVLNLAINSRDAMPEGGQLRLGTRNASVDAQSAQRKAGLHAGEYVCISVADTGAGMLPEVAARAFEPFFTTKPAGQGTGLGLSMVFGFIKQSKGYVELQSTPGRGTTVELYLPMHTAQEEVRPAPPAAEPVQPIASEKKTVLLVDDETSLRRLLAEMLREMGCEVIEARDAQEANATLAKVAHLDLIICDVGLPGGTNGLQLASAVRKTRPQLPALLITGYAQDVLKGNEKLEQGVQLLIKPFTLDVFSARVQSLLGLQVLPG